MNWKTSVLTQSGLKCDKPGCAYRDDTVTPDQFESSVGRQCPLCGTNLLTLRDFHLSQRLDLVMFWYNVVMFPYHVLRTIFSSSYRNKVHHTHTRIVMDDTGSITRTNYQGPDGSRS